MQKNRCVFLDRDGVINSETGNYIYRVEDFDIVQGVPEAIQILKENGYYLIVVTNQAGISKGLFTVEQMEKCHSYMNKKTNYLIDEIYYSRWHPSVSESLARKPGSLMFERAIAKFNIDPIASWMVGNAERDLIPARKMGLHTIFIGSTEAGIRADYYSINLIEAVKIILNQNH